MSPPPKPAPIYWYAVKHDRKGLARRIDRWTERGETIAMTSGVFDLLHAGHLRLFETARRSADRLVVAVNSDESVRSLTRMHAKASGRPVTTASDRSALIAALSCVDAVVVFNEATPSEVASIVLPDVAVVGDDHAAPDWADEASAIVTVRRSWHSTTGILGGTRPE